MRNSNVLQLPLQKTPEMVGTTCVCRMRLSNAVDSRKRTLPHSRKSIEYILVNFVSLKHRRTIY